MFKHVLNMQLTTGIAYTHAYIKYTSRNYDFLLSFI